MIELEELIEIPPMDDGLEKLKTDILNQAKVFCVCLAAIEYHVGAHDSYYTLEGATNDSINKEQKLKISYGDNPDNKVYTPLKTKDYLAEKIKGDALYYHDTVNRIYKVLQIIDKNYIPGERLINQPKQFSKQFLLAFTKLRKANILPSTTGNSAYNYQGMFLLMESCFKDHQRFIDYLKNPDILDIEYLKSSQYKKEISNALSVSEFKITSFLISEDGLALKLLDIISQNNSKIHLDYISNKLNIDIFRILDILSEFKKFDLLLSKNNTAFLTPKGIAIMNKMFGGNELEKKI